MELLFIVYKNYFKNLLYNFINMKFLTNAMQRTIREWGFSLLAVLYIVYVLFIAYQWFSNKYNFFYWDLLGTLPVFSISSYPLNNFLHAVPRNLYLSLCGVLAFICIGGYGRFVLSLIEIKFQFAERIILSQALGFGITGLIVFVVSSVQMLYASCLWTVLLAGLILGIVSLRKIPFPIAFFKKAKNSILEIFSCSEKGKITLKDIFFNFRMLPVLLVFFPSLLAFIGNLAPEPCVNDALNYHLAAPKYWLMHHGFADMPQHLFYNLFLLHGMAYTSILGTFGAGAVRIYYFLLYLISLVSIFRIGKRYFSMDAALWSLALIASSAPFVNAIQETCSEIPILFLVMSVLLTVLPLLESNDLKTENDARSLRISLAGFILGCSVAVKATCLFFVPGIAFIICLSNGHEIKKNMKDLCVFFCFFIIPVFPWLIKNYILKGNPFFPFMTSLFPLPEGYDAENISSWIKDVNHTAGLNPLNWLSGIRDVFFPKNNSYNSSVSFFAILWLPVFLIMPPKLTKLTSKLAIFTLISGILFFTATNIFRFLIPIYVLLMLFFSYQFESRLYGNSKNIARLLVFFISLLCFIPSCVYFHIRGMYTVPLGINTVSEWMQRFCPLDSVCVYSKIESLTNPSDKILLINTGTAFYLDRDYEAFSFYDRWPLQTKALKAKNSEEFFLLLRKEGFTHIYYDPWGFNFTKTIRNTRSDHAAAAIIHSFWNEHLETVSIFPPLPYQEGIPAMLLKITEKRNGPPPIMLYPDF